MLSPPVPSRPARHPSSASGDPTHRLPTPHSYPAHFLDMPSAPPDILTYRFNGTMVYVTPAATYEEGVQFARQVFPELSGFDPDRIAICINGLVHEKRQLIRIGPMAWRSIVFSRARFEVLDVTVDPEIVVTDADALPEYSAAAATKDKQPEWDFICPSRAPSPRTSMHKTLSRDRPESSTRSRSRSRSQSPSCSSSSRSDISCSPVEWAKSLFGKRVHHN